MRRRAGDGCPITAALQIIGDKWTLMIVRDLARAPRRTTELIGALAPISSRTLVGRLRDMEADALVERRSFAGSPPHVEYALTGRGRLLLPLLDALHDVGESLACDGGGCARRHAHAGDFCDACPRRPQGRRGDNERPAAGPSLPPLQPLRRRLTTPDDSIVLL